MENTDTLSNSLLKFVPSSMNSLPQLYKMPHIRKVSQVFEDTEVPNHTDRHSAGLLKLAKHHST